MTTIRSPGRGLAVALVLCSAACGPRSDPAAGGLRIPVAYHRLDNGLRVVLSEDPGTPTVVVALYYDVGFRTEPRGRTGFAHLFEHMMFQGSENLGKNEFIQLIESNGGVLNGSTRFDFTNYFQVVPAHTLETVLWAEADRMRGLAITQDNLTNQQGVVTNEVKVNVLNQPYGGFPWLDMPQYANQNWHNAHNFYGDLEDLEAATLEDVQGFFRIYYAPNNAVLVLVGDFEPERALAWIRQYFGDIPAAPAPARPDISEPRQEAEKRAVKVDPLATRPALAVAWHVPPRNTPEWYALGLIDQILTQGRDSRLYRSLVQEKALTGGVSGAINDLGNMFNISGPALYTVSLFHDADRSADEIMEALDDEIERLRTTPVDVDELERALVKMRSSLYSYMDAFSGFGRADLLASFALFDDDPARINRIEQDLRAVTPERILETAREWLRPTNRTILRLETRPAAVEVTR
jgi:zinc protease